MGHRSATSVRGARRSGSIRRRGLWLSALTIVGLCALPAGAAQADATWSGATPASSTAPNWSNATNWVGGVVPASSAGVLTFPDLSSNPACTAAPPTATCYTTSNDLGPISATGLVLSNTTTGSQYKIQGNALSIGAGGIMDNFDGSTGDLISAPLVLSANQTWRVGGISYNSLSVTGAVTGAPSSVTGTPSSLTVPFAARASGSSGDLFVASDMEVGPVAVSGSGRLHVGSPTGGGSVNGTNGNPVAINSGATLIANPNAKVGALSVATGSELLLGTGSTNTGAVTLAVTGWVTLDSSTTTQTYIGNNGFTPGTDFSQLTATGNVTLGGHLVLAQGPSGRGCATLSKGDVVTLITTTGRLSGTFANAADGAIMPMAAVTGSCSSPPQVRINYTANSVTATVVSGTTPTTTTLATPNPSPATTNRSVTLTATVTTNTNGNVTPAGTVAFSSSGTPIPGCTAAPITPGGSRGTATCTTSFPAASSPESLTAAFTGTTLSGQGSSISAPRSLTVNKGSTATALAASNRSPGPGASETYTATVTPGAGGASQPSGSVQFFDHATAITGCSAPPLSSSIATCTVTYPDAGSHSITATYGGDANFTPSTSPATSVTVRATPPPLPAAPAPRGAAKISATTSPATGLGTRQATLNGIVSSGGASVTWKFEYARTTTYNRATPLVTIAAGLRGPVSVSSVLKRLSPNVRYHYRLVISSPTSVNRSAPGRDLTFMTRATGRLLGPAGRLSVIGRTILVPEKCQSSVRCVGRFTFSTTVRMGKRKTLATVMCATKGFRIKAHGTATARVKLSARCSRLLRAPAHHRLVITYRAHTRTGQLGLRKRIALVLR